MWKAVIYNKKKPSWPGLTAEHWSDAAQLKVINMTQSIWQLIHYNNILHLSMLSTAEQDSTLRPASP